MTFEKEVYLRINLQIEFKLFVMFLFCFYLKFKGKIVRFSFEIEF